VAAAILRGAARTDKTVVTCFMGRHGVPEAVSSLRAKRFPSYAFPESAAAALARAARYGEWLATPEGAVPELAGIDAARAAPALDPGPNGPRWLRPDEVRAVLAAYGIRTPGSGEATTADEAVAIANEIGFPVAIKLASDTITHKTEVGGVALNLRDDVAVRAAFAAMRARLEEAGLAGQMRGVLVQSMAGRGVETFVGATRDPSYGPLLGFGIGGVNVELWKDVVFRVAPLRDIDARAMVDGIRARALLDGFRGGPRADKAAIVDVLLRVGKLLGDYEQVIELDINPLMASEEGALAVDARIRIGTRNG
jgi:acyl-CoA synthetase (NDP forming)